MSESVVLESNIPFAQSIIWDLNKTYYKEKGLSAWSDGIVPHNMTSSAFVGKTYAALILGFLKDVAAKSLAKNQELKTPSERIYIIELGSGHGRLAFHILRQLDTMVAQEAMPLPEYCLVVTDIVESNLDFFQTHPQFQSYIEQGQLDVAYYDGVESKELVLRVSGQVIKEQALHYPIVSLANYFFDSIPNDLYRINQEGLHACHITVDSALDHKQASASDLLKSLNTSIQQSKTDLNPQSTLITQLLKEYELALHNTFLLIPRLGIECLKTLKRFSKEGLMLITMDKGYSQLSDLERKPAPELVTHGSFSLYVNFHAFIRFCEENGGTQLFATHSDFSIQMGCFLFLPESDRYLETAKAYEHYVNDFGPDDFIGIKKLLLRNKKNLNIRELISGMRMSYYDSTLFLHLLPSIKSHLTSLSMEERKRLAETLVKTGDNFFAIKEHIDTNYEIGGILYDLGYYKKALSFFEQAQLISGEIPDLYYNKVLCHYQLRQDKLFVETLAIAKTAFPEFTRFSELDKLDLGAI